jgi:hypothetical protein
MILNPWAFGLTLCTFIMVLLLLRAVVPVSIIFFTGEKGSSEFALKIEKQEVLHSAILRLVFAYYICSPFLLTAAAFDLGKQIPGAMCALGTFNANPYGFPLVMIRLAGIFPVLSWGVLYAMDMQTPTTPFRHVRRPLLLLIFVWVLSDSIIQTLFFTSLDPHIITSCCAVVFDPTGSFSDNPAGLLARFPSAVLFFSAASVYLSFGLLAAISGKKILRLVYGLGAPVFFFFGLAALTSCISPYIYALPHHHCPFCILTGREGVIGIPIVISLYIGAVSGWCTGTSTLAGDFSGMPSSRKLFHRRACRVSIAGNMIFVGGSALVILLYRHFGELL